MAWIKAHRGADGQTYYYVYWRDPRTRKERHRALGPVPHEVALARRDEASRREEGRRPPAEALGAVQALDRFLKHRREVLRLKDETIRYYDRLLRPLFVALAARGPMKSWDQGWLEDYVAAHPARAPRYVQMLLVSARTFHRWAATHRVTCPPFAEGVRGPKVRPVPRRFYSAADVRALLVASKDGPMEVAIALAGCAGFSLGDLRAATGRIVDLRRGLLVGTRSKDDQPYAIPISRTLREVLKRRAPKDPDAPLCPLDASDSNVYKAWRVVCEAAGVDPSGGLKRLRHTYATMADELQIDSATRRDLMGHAPGSSQTGRYAHSDVTRLRDAVAKMDRALRERGAARASRSSRSEGTQRRPRRSSTRGARGSDGPTEASGSEARESESP